MLVSVYYNTTYFDWEVSYKPYGYSRRVEFKCHSLNETLRELNLRNIDKFSFLIRTKAGLFYVSM